MRVLLSTSFHEALPALAGFHLNWRAALSGRMVTMAHLSATTRTAMLFEMAQANAFPSADGLLVNPISIPTRLGTALPMMLHNHRTATRMGLDVSHICLASPYLYAFQPGIDDAMEQFDAGLSAATYPMNPSWYWYKVAAADQRLSALARYLGVELRCGRADGVFMTRTLFDDVIALLLRFFSLEEIMGLDPIYPLEEVIFPTIIPSLLGACAEGGKHGRIGTTRAKVWEPGDPPTPAKILSAIASGLHACGKRIPQNADHPIRQAVLANLPGPLVLNACLGSINA